WLCIFSSLFCSTRTLHPHKRHSFPTRRSSDLLGARAVALRVPALWTLGGVRVLVQAARVLSQLRRKAHDGDGAGSRGARAAHWRSEEHMSELQSRENLVCRLLLE